MKAVNFNPQNATKLINNAHAAAELKSRAGKQAAPPTSVEQAIESAASAE